VGRLVYSTSASLDGFIADERGDFSWSEPDEEQHVFVNDVLRPIGIHLYGRRLYEVMRVWETIHTVPDQPAFVLDFAAIWRSVDKVVYSRTLEEVTTARTRLERDLDPSAIREIKASTDRDLLVGGAGLASHAFAAGLVDDVQLFLAPVIVGGGTRALPEHVRLELDLVDERRFDNGVVHLRYRVPTSQS